MGFTVKANILFTMTKLYCVCYIIKCRKAIIFLTYFVCPSPFISLRKCTTLKVLDTLFHELICHYRDKQYNIKKYVSSRFISTILHPSSRNRKFTIQGFLQSEVCWKSNNCLMHYQFRTNCPAGNISKG